MKFKPGSREVAKKEVARLVERLSNTPWPEDFAEARIHYDSLGTPIAKDIHVKKMNVDGVAAEMLTPPKADDARIAIFLHGGGFVFGSLVSHGGMAGEIARSIQCKVLQLDYRRAPEHPFPAPIEDSTTAYRWLLKQGYQPKYISIIGDSAGGGLVVATLVALKAAGIPLPGAVACIAPWVDYELKGESYKTRKEIDPFVQKRTCEQVRDLYLGNRDPKTTSPIHADLTGLPPMLIQVGEREILFSDAEMLAKKAKAAGVDVTFEEWPEMVHVWHFYYTELSDSRRAMDRIGEFIRAKTS
jgi:acetyl esterase/lipase